MKSLTFKTISAIHLHNSLSDVIAAPFLLLISFWLLIWLVISGRKLEERTLNQTERLMLCEFLSLLFLAVFFLSLYFVSECMKIWSRLKMEETTIIIQIWGCQAYASSLNNVLSFFERLLCKNIFVETNCPIWNVYLCPRKVQVIFTVLVQNWFFIFQKKIAVV